ncbi:MAG TPA: ribonuclease HII [Gemmatimonadales bacterium]|nr:ribonuclease HII [Gemmatimonadales bacterium]
MKPPSITRERLAWESGRLLVGVDEVGRGPLAGPVVAAAVAFPPHAGRILRLRDSKVLTAKRREALAAVIERRAAVVGVGAASVKVIDRVNIRVATAIAMRRALSRALGLRRGERLDGRHFRIAVVIDGLPLPEIGMEHQAVVDGDALCYSIAAAGVVAKVVRDRLMQRLARRHPGYGWETNMGYGTPDHLAAIDLTGPCIHHRRSFAPVAQTSLAL